MICAIPKKKSNKKENKQTNKQKENKQTFKKKTDKRKHQKEGKRCTVHRDAVGTTF